MKRLFLILHVCLVGSVFLAAPGCGLGGQTAYVDQLTGAVWLKSPKAGDTWPEKIPFGAAITVYKESVGVEYPDTGGGSLHHKIRYGEREGWMQYNAISYTRPRHYYRVVSRTGLNLRGGPGINHKVLSVLPFSQVGEIIEPTPRKEKISGREGYWFKTNFKEQVGWIFSGFTMNSPSREKLEAEREARVRLNSSFLDEIPQTEKVYVGRGKSKQIMETEEFTVHHVKYKLDERDCDGPESRIYYKNKKTNKIYGRTDIVSEEPELVATPFERVLITGTHYCRCCCGHFENALYVLGAKGVQKLNYERAQTAGCFEGLPSSYESATRVLEEEGSILVFWQRPDCELSSEGSESESKPRGYSHDLFAVIQIDSQGDVKIKRFSDQGKIPEEYQERWERARPF